MRLETDRPILRDLAGDGPGGPWAMSRGGTDFGKIYIRYGLLREEYANGNHGTYS